MLISNTTKTNILEIKKKIQQIDNIIFSVLLFGIIRFLNKEGFFMASKFTFTMLIDAEKAVV